MRHPKRITPPPPKRPAALLAAVLAAMLAVCAEPGGGPAAPPEAPEDVVLNGDSIAFWIPGGGLADGVIDGGSYRCTSVEDCWEKCPKPKLDGTSTGCSCTRKKKKKEGDAERWTCVTRLIIDEEFGGGSGGGGGGGGSGEEDPDDDGELEDCRDTPVIAVDLKCNSHVERGKKIKCEVKPLDPKYDTEETQYEWSAECIPEFGKDKSDQCHATKEETGEAPSKWSGRVTMGATITVKVLHQTSESKLVTGSGRVTVGVLPRKGWNPDTKPMISKARLEKKVLNPPGGWESRVWGLFYNGWNVYATYSTKSGSGPWEGTVYLKKMPRFNGKSEMYTHPDLYEWGPGYGGARKKCGKKPTEDKVNVRTMNDACGKGSVLDGWRDYAERHERAHQTAYNECVNSSTIRTMAEGVEAVAASEAGMNGAVDDAQEQILGVLKLGQRTNQTWKFPEGMWRHRNSDEWNQFPEGTGSHSGSC